MLNGKSVLVTGGTGSFGKKFVGTVLKEYPEVRRLVVFSRDELKQWQLRQEVPDARVTLYVDKQAVDQKKVTLRAHAGTPVTFSYPFPEARTASGEAATTSARPSDPELMASG